MNKIFQTVGRSGVLSCITVKSAHRAEKSVNLQCNEG